MRINLKVCALVCKLKFTHKSVEKKCIGMGRGQIKFKNRSSSINLTRITTSACFNAIVYRCGVFTCWWGLSYVLLTLKRNYRLVLCVHGQPTENLHLAAVSADPVPNLSSHLQDWPSQNQSRLPAETPDYCSRRLICLPNHAFIKDQKSVWGNWIK